MRKIRNHFIRLLMPLIPNLLFPKINVYLFNLLGYKVSKTARVFSNVQITGDIEVVIGSNTYIGPSSILSGGKAKIRIGANCDISGNVSIICGTHEIDLLGERIAGKGIGKDISIGDGVWIGFGAIILPGIKIGTKSIIGAGCVVSKDVPSNHMAIGNPVVLKKLVHHEL